MKLLLISSVIPQDTMATELVLFRHFAAAQGEIEVAIASDHPDLAQDLDGIPIVPNSLLLRLTKTRLAPIAHALRHWPITFNSHALHTYLKKHRPDGIVTVAHGELYQLALETAQHLRIPLITFFHDWLPDLAWVTPGIRPFLTHRFLNLYRRSQIAFCVSEEMRQHLSQRSTGCSAREEWKSSHHPDSLKETTGKHPQALVLPPMPGSLTVPIAPQAPPSRPFTLAYAGNLSDCYRHPIQQLGTAIQSIPTLKLQLFGKTPRWPEEEIQQFKAWNIYGGFLSRDRLLQHLTQADALLVVMSFEPCHQKRMETSFPSKLLEYCQLGKPIVIWGPEYCSAVRWARQYAAAEVVTTPDVTVLLQAVYQLAQQQEQQDQLSRRVRQLANDVFSPAHIQQQFLSALKAAIAT